MSKLQDFKSAELKDAKKVEGQFFGLFGWIFGGHSRRRRSSWGHGGHGGHGHNHGHNHGGHGGHGGNNYGGGCNNSWCD